MPTRSIMPRNPPQLKRMRFWNTQLSSFGKIQNINYQHISSEGELGDNVEKMVNATRLQVQEMHKRNPLKPIILIGWDNAALMSLLVSGTGFESAVLNIRFSSQISKSLKSPGTPVYNSCVLSWPATDITSWGTCGNSRSKVSNFRCSRLQREKY